MSGCWLWTGAAGPQGYGLFRVSMAKHMVRAHRFAFEMAYGAPPPGLDVLHKCDNPPCVNPQHLFLGTALDNVRDMKRKGRDRQAIGADHWNARLTPGQVAEIRRRRAAGESGLRLAAEFGVTNSHIYRLAKYEIRPNEAPETALERT